MFLRSSKTEWTVNPIPFKKQKEAMVILDVFKNEVGRMFMWVWSLLRFAEMLIIPNRLLDFIPTTSWRAFISVAE